MDEAFIEMTFVEIAQWSWMRCLSKAAFMDMEILDAASLDAAFVDVALVENSFS